MEKIKDRVARLAMSVSLIAWLFQGCSSALRFDPTPEGEFQAAYHQYENGKFTKAIEQFKQVIYKYPGSDLVEQSRYYLADSYFQNKDFLLASNEFEQLTREFPQGRFADVSLFKAGLSYAEMSRRPERDQQETRKALETLQTLLAKYPNTEYADTTRKHIARLKDKLAAKEMLTVRFYYDRRLYDSAIIYLKGILSSYPESSEMPSALYHLYYASLKMGYPDDAEDARKWLCRDYPDSQYGRELCGSKPADDTLTGSPGDSTGGKKNE
ncbi:MAG: outer membrane protein assembly factor BamD [Candidatus Glassbacteria bacterium]